MDGGFLAQAFVYLCAACAAVPIARRLGLGSVLGYLLAGVAIGPFGLQLSGDAAAAMHFAEFGVVMMLFLVGLELQPARLWALRGPVLGAGGLQVGLTALAIAGLGLLLGADWRMALAAGLILAMSSTAIALQILAERGRRDRLRHPAVPRRLGHPDPDRAAPAGGGARHGWRRGAWGWLDRDPAALGPGPGGAGRGCRRGGGRPAAHPSRLPPDRRDA